MCQTLCHIQLLGGPSDGAVLNLDDASCPRTIYLPTRPISIAPACDLHQPVLEDCCSVYRLTREAPSLDSRLTKHCYMYSFAGFETAKNQSRGIEARYGILGRLAPLSAAIGRCREKAVRWMLAPVNHPLQLTK